MNLRAIEFIRSECEEILKNRVDSLYRLKGDTLTITGGTGFIGTWLTELVGCLNDQYHFGTQIFLIARGVDHFRKLRPHLANRKDVSLIHVRNPFDIPKERNWLVHAAASPDTRFHSTYPIETMTTKN